MLASSYRPKGKRIALVESGESAATLFGIDRGDIATLAGKR